MKKMAVSVIALVLCALALTLAVAPTASAQDPVPGTDYFYPLEDGTCDVGQEFVPVIPDGYGGIPMCRWIVDDGEHCAYQWVDVYGATDGDTMVCVDPTGYEDGDVIAGDFCESGWFTVHVGMENYFNCNPVDIGEPPVIGPEPAENTFTVGGQAMVINDETPCWSSLGEGAQIGEWLSQGDIVDWAYDGYDDEWQGVYLAGIPTACYIHSSLIEYLEESPQPVVLPTAGTEVPAVGTSESDTDPANQQEVAAITTLPHAGAGVMAVMTVQSSTEADWSFKKFCVAFGIVIIMALALRKFLYARPGQWLLSKAIPHTLEGQAAAEGRWPRE